MFSSVKLCDYDSKGALRLPTINRLKYQPLTRNNRLTNMQYLVVIRGKKRTNDPLKFLPENLKQVYHHSDFQLKSNFTDQTINLKLLPG
jgi:hypothetical protein